MMTISVVQENYKIIFEALITFLDSLDTYANFSVNCSIYGLNDGSDYYN